MWAFIVRASLAGPGSLYSDIVLVSAIRHVYLYPLHYIMVCTLLASFFLPSHLSFKNMYVYTCIYMPPSLLITEASKYLLQYLAQCSGHAGKVDLVKDRLIQSNPVLEVC